jgi:hypothetical protein
MALPPHLAKFDSLLDLVADAIAAELEDGRPQMETPAQPAKLAGVGSTTPQQEDLNHAHVASAALDGAIRPRP